MEELKISKLLQKKIKVKQVSENKYAISFPMYKVDRHEGYEIYLISKNDQYILSDEGSTYKELDAIFELSEPDVIKNLVAILRQYGCKKHRTSNAFYIECTLDDLHIKLSYLIQALSFMLNMKIFYI